MPNEEGCSQATDSKVRTQQKHKGSSLQIRMTTEISPLKKLNIKKKTILNIKNIYIRAMESMLEMQGLCMLTHVDTDRRY